MIDSISLKKIASEIKANYQGKDISISRVSTDTRCIKPNDLFIALSGDKFDGHNYINSAIEKGACAVVCERPMDNLSVPCLQVNNSVNAYGLIARINRRNFKGKILALTGSVGKTTTRSMLANILENEAKTNSSQNNENNEIGVPKTLLSIKSDDDYSVIEFGARNAGDIKWLNKITEPNYGLILNIAEAHLETFGNLDKVAEAKSEIFKYLPNNAISIVNKDDSYFSFLAKQSHGEVYTFSTHDRAANLYLSDIKQEQNSTSFNFHISTNHNNYTKEASLKIAGKHYLINACAAILSAELMGCSAKSICEGLATFSPVDGRQKTIKIDEKTTLIDDSYNANPASMKAAIDLLSSAKQEMKILVIGDMLELGDKKLELHNEIGKYAAKKNITSLISYGELASNSVNCFSENSANLSFAFQNYKDAAYKINEIISQSKTNNMVVIKGSRSMRMEEIIKYLK